VPAVPLVTGLAMPMSNINEFKPPSSSLVVDSALLPLLLLLVSAAWKRSITATCSVCASVW
jgi:hypothetical protein